MLNVTPFWLAAVCADYYTVYQLALVAGAALTVGFVGGVLLAPLFRK